MEIRTSTPLEERRLEFRELLRKYRASPTEELLSSLYEHWDVTVRSYNLGFIDMHC
jgi:hypothetical protein